MYVRMHAFGFYWGGGVHACVPVETREELVVSSLCSFLQAPRMRAMEDRAARSFIHSGTAPAPDCTPDVETVAQPSVLWLVHLCLVPLASPPSCRSFLFLLAFFWGRFPSMLLLASLPGRAWIFMFQLKPHLYSFPTLLQPRITGLSSGLPKHSIYASSRRVGSLFHSWLCPQCLGSTALSK